MKLIDLYTHILAAANLYPTTDGYVNRLLAGEKGPHLIKGKRLILPTQANLRKPPSDDVIFFTPAREVISHGESEVMQSYRTVLNTRLNVTVGLLLAQFIQLSMSQDEHRKLDPLQSEILSLMKNADEKTFKTLAKIIGAMPIDQSNTCFVSIFLKKGGELEGKKYNRLAVVYFPFFNELQSNPKEIYGVKIDAKDVQIFTDLMKYIFPNIETRYSYSFGSNSDVSPTLEAVMGAVDKVASALNDQIDRFANILEDVDELKINMEWVEPMQNMAQFRNEIRDTPMQPGNEGTTSSSQAQPIEGVGQTGVRPFVPAATAPAVTHAPGAHVDFAEARARALGQQPQQMPYVAPPGMMYPGMVVGQGMMGVAPGPVGMTAGMAPGMVASNRGFVPVAVPQTGQTGFGVNAPFGYYGGGAPGSMTGV